MTKTRTIRMPGKERPAAARLVIQSPHTTELHQKNLSRNTKPSAGRPVRQTTEGIVYRFLRSQPRVIGPGSLHKARPRRSEYKLTMHPVARHTEHKLISSIHTLQTHAAAR